MKMIFKKIAISSISMFLLASCTSVNNNSIDSDDSIDSVESNDSIESIEPKEYSITATNPINNSQVSLASEDITEMYQNYSFACSQKYVCDEDHYASRGIDLSWMAKDEALYYLVEITTTNDFSDNVSSFVSNDASLHLDDLKPGYKYFWRVNAFYENKIIRSQVFNFETLSISKSYYMETVKNFRDMGGYKTIDGKRVKSGLVFRGANADGVSTDDKNFMLNTLNIKTELDLRNANEGKRNVLGVENCVEVSDYGGLYYDSVPNGISKTDGHEVLAKEIKLFAKRDNYPIYYHCAIGRDRTGSLAMILYYLLGVDSKDIGVDYEISFFAVASTRDVYDGIVSELLHQLFLIRNYIYARYTGNNMKEKTFL